jgi:hypothetical protein
MQTRPLGSRACSFPTCSWLSDYAGPDWSLRYRSRQCCLPVMSTRSAPERRFSKLNSRPVGASVYASPGTSRHPAQDSRSRWFATPFSWGSFIPDCTPVYPDDCAHSHSRLGKALILLSRAGNQPNATYFVPVFRGTRLRHCVRASAWTGVAFLTINDSGFLANARSCLNPPETLSR